LSSFVCVNGVYSLWLGGAETRDKCQIQIEPMTALVTSHGRIGRVRSSFFEDGGETLPERFEFSDVSVAIRVFLGKGVLVNLFVQNNRPGQACYVQLHDSAADQLPLQHPAAFYYPLPPGGDYHSDPNPSGFSTLSLGGDPIPFREGCVIAYSWHPKMYQPIPFETPPPEPIRIPQYLAKVDANGNPVQKTELDPATNTRKPVYVEMDPPPYKTCHGTFMLLESA
jgi:hypothetical protein